MPSFAGLRRGEARRVGLPKLMVTGHSSPILGWRPGRESNPEHSPSQGEAVIQTEGATKERSTYLRNRLVF